MTSDGERYDHPERMRSREQATKFMAEDIVKIIVSGRVQGVGFRFYCQRKAHEFGISGWARNCSNGTVEVRASGTDEALSEFVTALKRGPKFGRVEDISVNQSGDGSVTDIEAGAFQIR